jgi:integrase
MMMASRRASAIRALRIVDRLAIANAQSFSLRRALSVLHRKTADEGAVIRSERAGARGMRPSSIVNWFGQLYRELGLNGCSSHSGRRSFITNAARLVFKAGGSLRDVQQLAGHRSIEQTQAYIDASARARRRLIELM